MVLPGTRDNDAYLKCGFIGDNGTGKSTTILAEIMESYDVSIHRILIICQTTPAAYRHLKRLTTYDELRRFESGIALFWDYDIDPHDMLTNIIHILDEGAKNLKLHIDNPKQYPFDPSKYYLHNGCMVLEDSSNYIDPYPAKIIRTFLGNYRMYFLDLFIAAHTFTDFSSFLRRRMTTFTVFKTSESLSLKDFKTLRYPNTENLYETWARVMNDASRYKSLNVITGV